MKKDTNQWEKEIRQICTYYSDEGTCGYLLSEEQFGQLFSLIKEIEQKSFEEGKKQSEEDKWHGFWREDADEAVKKSREELVKRIKGMKQGTHYCFGLRQGDYGCSFCREEKINGACKNNPHDEAIDDVLAILKE